MSGMSIMEALFLPRLALVLLSAATLQEGNLFTEVTDEAGVDFRHETGDEGNWWFPEVMGSGAAFLDYDNDGDLDIYLIQAGGPPEPRTGITPPREPNRLFRQDGDGTFTDQTAESGLGDRGYGTGVGVGDMDNDGFVDIYVANYGPDALFHNEGNGRFTNVTERAGIGGDEWSSSVVFCDYDGDGFLDIYVTNYSKHDKHKECVSSDGSIDYCSPQSFPGTSDILYHNSGDGTFTDASRPSGIGDVAEPGLGVVCVDFNGDGRMDFYITNDGEPNHQWENQGDGTFVEQAFLNAVALNHMGRKEAGMGVDVGDVDGDGDLDLFMTHLKDQTHTLYTSEGDLGFDDRSSASGIGALSLPWTGFGTGFIDFDNDGDLDIAIVNGRAYIDTVLEGAGSDPHWSKFAEPNTLMENDGGGKFNDVSSTAGTFASQVEVGRGMAFGDVDNDGDVDILLNNGDGPARLFRNDAPKNGSWLMVRALDSARKRDAPSAVITLTAGGKEYVRGAQAGYGYRSSSDPRAHFGVPGADAAESIRVLWPDGTEEAFPGIELNQSIVLEKGKGKTR